MSKPICVKKHQIKSLFFCQTCAKKLKEVDYAKKSKQLDIIFYCKQCNPKIAIEKHGNHLKFSLQSQDFKKRFNNFKAHLSIEYNKQVAQLVRANNKVGQDLDLKETYQKLIATNPVSYCVLQKTFSYQEFNNEEFKIWLLKVKFWEFESNNTKPQTLSHLRSGILTDIEHNPVITQIHISPQKNMYKEKSPIEVPPSDCKIDIMPLMKETQLQFQNIAREQKIVNFLIELYSSFSIPQCETTLTLCDRLISEYPKEIILYYTKIRLLQLLPKGCEKIEEVLSNISAVDPSFIQKPLYFYFNAIKWWRMIGTNTNKDQTLKNVFYEPKNQQYYILDNPEAYVQELTKAIGLSQHQAFYSARGLGYIILGQMSDASKDFQKALAVTTNYDSIRNNFNYAQSKEKTLRQTTVLEGLSLRNRQFIVNAAKLFKKQKKYQRVAECCQVLLRMQPYNELIQVQLLKALVRGNDVDKERIFQAEEILKKLSRSKTQEFQKCARLEKILRMAKGRKYYKEDNLEEAIREFQQLTSASRRGSATVFYNTAVTYYQLEQWEEAHEAINKALAIKQKPQYRLLLTYICCMLKEFDKAYEQLAYFDSTQKIYAELVEFVTQQCDLPTQ